MSENYPASFLKRDRGRLRALWGRGIFPFRPAFNQAVRTYMASRFPLCVSGAAA
jgi:hypothetical protein